MLDDAYVDGQLSDADRSLRVSNALAARTLGDLDALVGDLQGAAPVRSAVPTRRAIAIAGSAVAAVLVVIIGVTSLGDDGANERAAVADQPVEAQQSSSAPTVAPRLAEIEEPPPATTAKPLTRRYFEDFLDAYRERFGDTEIYSAGFYEAGYVTFKRPFSRARTDLLQDWDWYPDEGFDKSIVDASANVFESAPFDLAPVTFRALARHVVQGRKYLGVTSPRMYVGIDPKKGDVAQVIEVRASNSHGDYGSRYVGPGGRLIDSSPFVIPD